MTLIILVYQKENDNKCKIQNRLMCIIKKRDSFSDSVGIISVPEFEGTTKHALHQQKERTINHTASFDFPCLIA